MVDLAREGRALFIGADAAGRPKARPANPTAEATNIARRLSGGVGECMEECMVFDLGDLQAIADT